MTRIVWTTRFLFLMVALWIMTSMLLLYIEFEGQIMPVVGPLEIIELEEQANGWTRITGQFEKIRDCQPISIRWYQGDSTVAGRLDRIPVPVRIGEMNDIPRALAEADIGEVQTNTIYVRLDAETILNNSYAQVYHYCHNRRLWETRSLFYISNRDLDS